MTKLEAFKAMLEGVKVVSGAMSHEKTYAFWDEQELEFKVRFGADGDIEKLGGLAMSDQWKLFVVPKAQPKFTIGSSVLYRSNRLAKIVSVTEEPEGFVYVLNADPEQPNCTFKKNESELKEVA
jgi:hypothetical protein